MPKGSDNNINLNRKITEFLDHLQAINKSPHTVKNYLHYLARFSDWVYDTNRGNSTMLTPLLLKSYKDYLTKLRLSNKTVYYHLIAIRSFVKWLKREGGFYLEVKSIPLPKMPGSSVRAIAGEEADKLLAAPDTDKTIGLRDKAILELFFSTGVRVSELIGLNRDNIDMRKREFAIKDGREVRLVQFSARSQIWLQRYLEARRDKYSPLFIRLKGGKIGSNKDARLTARSVQRMVKKYVKQAGLSKDVTPHTLRHSLATNLLSIGADYARVQKILGHKNIQITESLYREIVE